MSALIVQKVLLRVAAVPIIFFAFVELYFILTNHGECVIILQKKW